MRLVLHERTTEAAAELILAVVAFDRRARALDFWQPLGLAQRIHALVAEELEHAAGGTVGAALGDHTQHAAVAAAVLGLEALRLEVELLHCFERKLLQQAADRVVVVVAAVNL